MDHLKYIIGYGRLRYIGGFGHNMDHLGYIGE